MGTPVASTGDDLLGHIAGLERRLGDLPIAALLDLRDAVIELLASPHLDWSEVERILAGT